MIARIICTLFVSLAVALSATSAQAAWAVYITSSSSLPISIYSGKFGLKTLQEAKDAAYRDCRYIQGGCHLLDSGEKGCFVIATSKIGYDHASAETRSAARKLALEKCAVRTGFKCRVEKTWCD